jgi:riboflavin synthase
MFTGIVQGRGCVVALDDHTSFRRLTVELPEGRAGGLETGASVSVAGTCLTAVEIDGPRVCFDVIDETLRLTTLGGLTVGDAVNIERAATFGSEIGGHVLSGHIMGTAELVRRVPSERNLALYLRLPPAMHPYVLPKGYVSVDGCSLTVGTVEDGVFSLHIIPETIRLTTLGDRAVGDRFNIEVDAMTQAVVETVQRVLAARTDLG